MQVKLDSQKCCRWIATPAPQHSIFYWPDALPDAQPTVSKQWSTENCKHSRAQASKHLPVLSTSIHCGWKNIYFALPFPKKYCDEYIVLVCLSVCQSVCLHNSKTTHRTSPNFLCMLPVAMAQSSCDMLRTFSFTDDVTFSYCGTSVQNQAHRHVQKSLQGRGTSSMSDNYSVWLSSSQCITSGKICYRKLPCLSFVFRLSYSCSNKVDQLLHAIRSSYHRLTCCHDQRTSP